VGFCVRATTHSDLLVRAKTLGIEVEVVHNASIMNAVGACGLQLYRFGEAISIPFFTETWRPDSFYDKIKANRTIGLHTLCLLGMSLAMWTGRFCVDHCGPHLVHSSVVILNKCGNLRFRVQTSHCFIFWVVVFLFLFGTVFVFDFRNARCGLY
jgi:diphthine synthase